MTTPSFQSLGQLLAADSGGDRQPVPLGLRDLPFAEMNMVYFHVFPLFLWESITTGHMCHFFQGA